MLFRGCWGGSCFIACCLAFSVFRFVLYSIHFIRDVTSPSQYARFERLYTEVWFSPPRVRRST